MSEKAAALCAEGLELMTRHMWEEAEVKMTAAVKEDPSSPELQYNLGKCLFHQDKFEEAKGPLRSAIMFRSSESLEEGIVYPVHGKRSEEHTSELQSH